MARSGIGVLGPLTVEGIVAALPPRDRVVLAALALRPGEVVSTEELADALWGDQPPASWHKVVPGCVMRLRRVLGADAIATVPGGYRLILPADDVDARRFERLVGRARELLTLGEPDRAAHLAGEALELWRGHPLRELDGWDAGRIEAARLEELHHDAEELRVDAALRAGRYRDVLGDAQALVVEAPLRERRWALLATAQYQAGRQGEALRTLHRARIVLTRELGIDPGPDLVALERAILVQDPSLAARDVGPEPTTTCPYPGLVAYDVDDAEGFFGRDADVAECLRRLTSVGVLVVVGPSGSGKSSLVRAGVAAALVRNGARVAIVTPGTHPMDALTGVADARPAPVLVVDQCEQAVALCRDGAERTRFFAALVDRAQHAPLVVAMRADRLGDVTTQVDFTRLVERGLHLLAPMTEADLRAAIEGPAHQAGLLLEAGLVDLLVREVEGEPGALPLLSHALRQTWERREGRTLTVAGYRATGGITGAVAQSAEDLYEQLVPEQRADVRDLLLRLVEPSVDGEPVPSPVPRRTLLTDPDHDHLVDLLVDARLVTSDDGVVELSHESLARAWPRLRGWLDDDVDGQRIRRHLSGAADAWDSMGRPDTELYRGVRLTRAMEWSERTEPALTTTERAFLDGSRRQADAERRAHRRSRRRRRAAISGVAVLVVIAVFAGLLAIRQAQRADDAAAAADARRTSALARRVSAQALVTPQADRALLLAVEGARLDESAETSRNLLTVLTRQPALPIARVPGDEQRPIAVSPDGDLLAGAEGGQLVLRDAHTLDVVRSAAGLGSSTIVAFTPNGDVIASTEDGDLVLRDADTLDVLGHTADVAELGSPDAVAFHPGGDQLAVAYPDATDDPVRLYDARTLEPAAAQLGGVPEAGRVETVGYSPHGGQLAVVFSQEHGAGLITVVVWDTSAPDAPTLRIELQGPFTQLEFSADEARLYVNVYPPGDTYAYDTATGEQVAASAGTGGFIEVSPDGAFVAATGIGPLYLLDAETLAEVRQLPMPSGDDLFFTPRFSRDGTRLVAVGRDSGQVYVWEVAGDDEPRLIGKIEASWNTSNVLLNPDDDTVYTSTRDALTAWDGDGGRGVVERHVGRGTPGIDAEAALPVPGGLVAYVAGFSRLGGRDGSVQVLDVASSQLGEVVDVGHDGLRAITMRADGTRFVTTGEDGAVKVWSSRTGALLAERQVSAGVVTGVAYAVDDTRLVVSELQGDVYMIDAETLAPTGPRVRTVEELGVTSALPNQPTALVATAEGDVRLVDLSDGRVVETIDPGFEAFLAAASPDGRRLAITGQRGEVRLYDLEVGEWLGPPVQGHAGAAGARFAADGSLFLTSGFGDGRLGVWDGATGELVGTVFPGTPNVPIGGAFVGDSRVVVAASVDGTLYTWDADPAHWIDLACAAAGRNLSLDEWHEAFGDAPYRETCPSS